MEGDTPPQKKSAKAGFGVLAVVMLAGLAGFIGGFFAIRLSDVKLGGSGAEEHTEVVLSESAVISDVAEKLKPSVVSISVETISRDFFSRLYTEQGAGTGIIVSADGLVLTNRHVIPDNVSSVSLVATDGTVYKEVEVVDRDPLNDIAFLRIKDAKDLPAATLGNSDAMRVGDKVIAIGNALGQFENTVTSGIISGTGRPLIAGSGESSEVLTNLFQTDAAINPGNSGGPLVNINGEVIGVNTAVAGNAENIGFAIPINDVKPVLESVLETGEITRPYLGVRYIMLTPAIAEELKLSRDQGALITAEGSDAVLNDSPAAKAGLQEGDIIIEVNGQDVTTKMPLAVIVSRQRVGDTVVIKYFRGQDERSTEAVLEAIPTN